MGEQPKGPHFLSTRDIVVNGSRFTAGARVSLLTRLVS
jgi:hypothetical protein